MHDPNIAGGHAAVQSGAGRFPGEADLYARNGFVACPPFGDYGPDPNSVFMTRPLDRASS